MAEQNPLDFPELQQDAEQLRASMHDFREGLDLISRALEGLSGAAGGTQKALNEDTVSVFKNSQAFVYNADVLKSFGKTATAAAADLSKGLFTTTTKIAGGEAKLDTYNSAIEGAGSAVSKFVAMLPGPQAKAAALAIEGLTKAFGAMNTVAQESLDMFQNLSDVGAAGTEGIANLRRSANSTLLTYNELTAVAKENATSFSNFGGTVAEGTKEFEKIQSNLANTDDQLRNLGYTSEGMAKAASSYMTLQNRLGLSQTKRDRDLQEGARQYLNELDALSKATGRSREEIAKQNEKLAVDRLYSSREMALRGQGAEGERKATQERAVINVAEAKDVTGQLSEALKSLFSGTYTDDARKLIASTPGIMEAREALEKGTIDANEFFNRIKKGLAETEKQLGPEGAKALGIGEAQGKNPLLSPAVFNQMASATEDAINKGAEESRKAATAPTPETEDLVQSKKNAEQTRAHLQDIATDALPAFAKGLRAATHGLERMANAAKDAADETTRILNGEFEKTGFQKTKEALPGYSPMLDKVGQLAKSAVTGAVNLIHDNRDLIPGHSETMERVNEAVGGAAKSIYNNRKSLPGHSEAMENIKDWFFGSNEAEATPQTVTPPTPELTAPTVAPVGPQTIKPIKPEQIEEEEEEEEENESEATYVEKPSMPSPAAPILEGQPLTAVQPTTTVEMAKPVAQAVPQTIVPLKSERVEEEEEEEAATEPRLGPQTIRTINTVAPRAPQTLEGMPETVEDTGVEVAVPRSMESPEESAEMAKQALEEEKSLTGTARYQDSELVITDDIKRTLRNIDKNINDLYEWAVDFGDDIRIAFDVEEKIRVKQEEQNSLFNKMQEEWNKMFGGETEGAPAAGGGAGGAFFGGGGSPGTSGVTPSGPVVSGKAGGTSMTGTASQREYYDKMYKSLFDAAVKKGVANPEAVARLGAAQTSIETGYGRHMVGNNAFGIKGVGTAGTTSASTTEVINGKTVRMNQGFRKYNDVTESASDYIDFLQKNKRYKGVLAAGSAEEAISAQGRTGYATDPSYAAKLAMVNAKFNAGGASVTPLTPEQIAAAKAAPEKPAEQKPAMPQTVAAPEQATLKPEGPATPLPQTVGFKEAAAAAAAIESGSQPFPSVTSVSSTGFGQPQSGLTTPTTQNLTAPETALPKLDAQAPLEQGIGQKPSDNLTTSDNGGNDMIAGLLTEQLTALQGMNGLMKKQNATTEQILKQQKS